MTTKPDWCPQWAWDEAYDPGEDAYMAAGWEEAQEIVARAILKAKNDAYEECAKIADPIHYEGRMSDYEKQAFDIRDAISQAIRNLKHETEV